MRVVAVQVRSTWLGVLFWCAPILFPPAVAQDAGSEALKNDSPNQREALASDSAEDTVVQKGELIEAPTIDEEPSKDQPDAQPCNNGPRRVPKAQGKPYQRAKRLGLGTRQAGSLLLRAPPSAQWIAASQGRSTKRLLWPIRGAKVGRGFGFTRKERRDLKHEGLDIRAARGALIRAAADGIVAYSDNGLCGYGNVVLLVHANGWVTLYAHNDRNLVQAGTRLQRGDPIGFVGSTGRARGAHLHFELRVRGKAVDPMNALRPKPKKRK